MREDYFRHARKDRVPTYAEATTVPEEIEVFNILKSLAENEDAYEDAQGETIDFVQNLQQKYPDIYEYSLAQILSGSTPNPDITTKVDLPGEDSMLLFMRRMREKYAKG